MIAANYAFGTPFTFQSEADAYRQYPQLVAALKNEYHKLRKEGIANIAATGEFGAPLLASSSSGTTTGTASTTTTLRADNNAQNTAVGDVKGISLPAVINEVISVTGVYSFPFIATPSTSPIDTPSGVIPRPAGPILLFGSNLTIGGTASIGSGSSGTTNGTGTTTGFNANAEQLAAADFTIWVDRIPGAVNTSPDDRLHRAGLQYPDLQPDFRGRDFQLDDDRLPAGREPIPSGIVNPLTFTEVGTSMSAAIVTGAYALVSSALNYWTNLAHPTATGRRLPEHAGRDQYAELRQTRLQERLQPGTTPAASTASWPGQPCRRPTPTTAAACPRPLPCGMGRPTRLTPRSRVSNAVAAIEGYVRRQLPPHAPRLQVDHSIPIMTDWSPRRNSRTFVTMPRHGSGRSRRHGDPPGRHRDLRPVRPASTTTVFNENPDHPGAGSAGSISSTTPPTASSTARSRINELKMLSRTLLPSPDAYTIIDRQRASANGFLLAPSAPRNFIALQPLRPGSSSCPRRPSPSTAMSPRPFTVGRGRGRLSRNISHCTPSSPPDDPRPPRSPRATTPSQVIALKVHGRQWIEGHGQLLFNGRLPPVLRRLYGCYVGRVARHRRRLRLPRRHPRHPRYRHPRLPRRHHHPLLPRRHPPRRFPDPDVVAGPTSSVTSYRGIIPGGNCTPLNPLHARP